ncbi:MAG: SUMF1/EgtB/PvdO family nonheme iron enzyme [Desulfobacterales bacterium]|nr:SUMF1/EgtB/PvdO family nonheme iron enzyme [Desulfobacterales bacterium]
MKIRWLIVFIGIVGISIFTSNSIQSSNRDIGREVVSVKTQEGNNVELYSGSYALLIGESNYTAGWPKLETIPREISDVKAMLEKQGFLTKDFVNLNYVEYQKAIETFINDYGFDKDNRLLFYLSGHGYTSEDNEKGYLVPVDAPNPKFDKKGFLRKALTMDQILAWSRRIEAKHVLFLFDSCFSGTVFKSKDLPEVPPYISKATVLPVRQYLTAGSANETVPSISVFTPIFIDAIEYGFGDMNKDGYISGKELGLYLQTKVPDHAKQSPQSGTISDYKLSRGDFIFVIQKSKKNETILSVESFPDGSSVWINGVSKGTAPVSVSGLSEGTVSVRVVKEGYEAWEQSVIVRKNQKMEVKSVLKKKELKVTIAVSSSPDRAGWYLDGSYAGTTPDELSNVSAGEHTIEIKKEGYKDWSKDVTVSFGKVRVDAKLERKDEEGKSFTNSIGQKFVYIKPGTFMMGSPLGEEGRDSDEVQHSVTISKGFYMQTTEVTQGQWKDFVDETGYKTEAETGDGAYGWTGSEWKKDKKYNWKNPGFSQDNSHPVTCVSWNDVKTFISWLNKKENTSKYRLPTEAEWEFAARAGTTSAFANGGISEMGCGNEPNLDKMGWYCGNSGNKTHPVAQKQSNAWGLYDMHGNVWEWCSDWYGGYPSSSVTDPVGVNNSSDRVLRGGSWGGFAWLCRSALRSRDAPGGRYSGNGFRVAASLGQ